MNVYLETMGCPKNIVDSENAAGLLQHNGYTVVKSPKDAQVILINTCGFIGDAKEESIRRIFELAEYKEGGSCCSRPGGARLVVTGCLSQRYSSELSESLPEADLLLGVNDYEKLPELLKRFETDGGTETKCRTYASEASKEYPSFGPRCRLEGTPETAYLKIAEGCNNVCAYCIIPKIRGPYRSRPMEDVLAEARTLAAEGVRELVVVAQDTTAYGCDWDGHYHLDELLRSLCSIEGIHWIRMLYCYEDRITDGLIRTMAEEPKICHYIDIPIQHASNAVLKAMRRRSTRESTHATLEKLRKAIPDLVIRTTLITGFPGETKEDFAELKQFVQEEQFDRLGVFAFSKEEGTAAALMKPQVRKDVKERRRDTVMALQQTISLERNKRYIGRTLEVLVEEPDEEPGKGENAFYTYLGRTAYDAPEIDNSVLLTSTAPIPLGTFVQAEIVDAYDYDLVGRVE